MDLVTKKRGLTKESKRRGLREGKEKKGQKNMDLTKKKRGEIAKWRKGMSQGS